MKATMDSNNLFERIQNYGHDEDFIPLPDDNFHPTSAPPGSAEKLSILAERVQQGQPLWHQDDRVDYAGIMTGKRVGSRSDYAGKHTSGIKVCTTPRFSKGLSKD
jgi:hypothetical protein